MLEEIRTNASDVFWTPEDAQIAFEENRPRQNTDSLTRFGMSVFMPIDLRHRTGNRSIGDFSPKTDRADGKKMNSQNLAFFPYMNLMVFYGVRTDIPFELPAQIVKAGSPEATPAPFDSQIARTNQGVRELYKSPRQCIDEIELEYGDMGFVSFDSFMGYEHKDVKAMIDIVYPQIPLIAIPVTQRTKLEITVKGPFLDEIRHYFRVKAEERINHAAKEYQFKSEQVDQLDYIKDRLTIGCEKGWKWANQTLNESESSIKEKEKKSYDMPDYRFSQNAIPRDIYLMAHTNRNPIDLKQLEAAQEMTKGVSAPIEKALETLIANQTRPSIDMDALQQLIEDKMAQQRAELQAEFAEERKKLEAQIKAKK